MTEFNYFYIVVSALYILFPIIAMLGVIAFNLKFIGTQLVNLNKHFNNPENNLEEYDSALEV